MSGVPLWSAAGGRRRIVAGIVGLAAAAALSGGLAVAFSGGGPEAVTIGEGSSAEAAAVQSAVTPARVERLTASTETDSAWLGVAVHESDSGPAITFVFPDGPAAAAALQEGDVITALGGSATPTVEALKDALATHAPGDEVDLTYLRDGSAFTTSVTLGERPERLHRDGPHFSFGFLRAGAGRLVRSETTFLDADGNLVTTLTVSGAVAAISAASITVELNGGAGSETFSIDADTHIFPQDAAVAVGDSVMVMSQDGIATQIVDSTQAAELIPEGFEGHGGFRRGFDGFRSGRFGFGRFGSGDFEGFAFPRDQERLPDSSPAGGGATNLPF